MSQKKVKKTGTARKTSSGSPPAYFLSVSVENIRCFSKQQTLDLSDGNGKPAQWTVILGENGTGKTTLLQSIAMLECTGPHAMGPVEQPWGLPKYIDTLMSIPNQSFFWKPIRNRGNRAIVQSSVLCGYSYTDTVQDLTRLDYRIRLSTSQGDNWTPIEYSSLAELKCYGYGALRRLASSALTNELKDATTSLFLDDAVLINAEEWLLQIDYSIKYLKGKEQEKVVKLLEAVKNILIALLPDIQDIHFIQIDNGSLFQRIGVEFRTPYGWVPLQELGLGYRTMIAWMVDLAARLLERYPDSPNPLAEPAIVLIDEIDLHLHPRWQRNLISHISERFPNTQFIVTAHSPLIVQAAENANVVLLKREGDHVVIENHVKVPPGLRIDQLLTSELFGLESAHSPQVEELIRERTKIRSKARLSAADKKRLQQLDEELENLPTGETTADREAMEVIRQVAAELRKSKQSP